MGGGGKKGGGASQAKNYYGSVAGGVCIGAVDELVAVLVNSEECWPRGTPWSVGMGIEAGGLYVFDAQTWVCTSNHVASSANAPDGTDASPGWTEYSFPRPADWATNPAHRSSDFTLIANDETVYGKMTFYWGTNLQTVDEILRSDGNNLSDQHPDYKGFVYVVIKDFLLGQEVQSAPNIEIIVRRKPDQSIITGTPSTIVDGQANLAAVAAELLTNQNTLGISGDMIDADSFQAVADYLQTNQELYGASVLIDSSDSINSVFEKLIQMFDGYVRFNPETKKVELGLFKHGVIPTGYKTLTADSFTKVPSFNCESWQNATSRATVRYNSRQLNYAQTSTQSDDARVFSVLGSVREKSLDRPWITRPSQAIRHGAEALRVIGLAQMKGELEVRREIGRDIRAGDYVLVNIDLEPNTNSIFKFFRVISRTIPPIGPISLSVMADNATASVVASVKTTPLITPFQPVSPIETLRYTEVPYALSQQEDSIICLARRPENATNTATLYFDTTHLIDIPITSIVADGAGTSGVITFSAAHGLIACDEIDVVGADVAGFNVKRVAITSVAGDMVTYPLSAAVAPSSAATGAFQVADYNGTFSMLGRVPSFAANAVLSGGIAADATAVDLTVDESQVDADYFTQDSGVNAAENDDILLFVLEKDVAPDADQIAESGAGCVKMEIMSVIKQEKLGGYYHLTVLRGRKGSTAQAFAGDSEAWLIPRALLVYFTHALFKTLRANRHEGLIPDRSMFRLCPNTHYTSLPLADADTVSFRFQNCTAGSGWSWSPPGYHTQSVPITCTDGTITYADILVKD